LAGVGLVCNECNNYNTPAKPTEEQLLEHVLESQGLSRYQVECDWKKTQPTKVLPCFRCKKETCKETHSNEIELTEKEVHDMDGDDTLIHYGQCCTCAKLKKKDKCKDCNATASKSRKRIKR
jgi:hypothetical protein